VIDALDAAAMVHVVATTATASVKPFIAVDFG
jgi:hypothetical protein